LLTRILAAWELPNSQFIAADIDRPSSAGEMFGHPAKPLTLGFTTSPIAQF
jgi:hypothetical protein